MTHVYFLSIVCCLSLCVNTDYTASWQIIQDVICKSTENEVKKCFCVWDVDAAGSNPVTPTKKARERFVFSLAFLMDVSIRSCFAKQNAGSHSPLGDRQALLSGEERGNHVAQRSYPVTPTKFGFGKQFPKPFSLLTATQILRADGLFSSAPLGIHFYSINWNLFY